MHSLNAQIEKKCRKCKEPKVLSEFNLDRLGKHGVASTCKECLKQKSPRAGKNKGVKNIQKRGHKFSDEVKQEIQLRDKMCINPYCKRLSLFLHCHHVFFHPLEKLFDFVLANLADKGVLLCRECHRDLHDGNTWLDVYCHTYLYRLYPYLRDIFKKY